MFTKSNAQRPNATKYSPNVPVELGNKLAPAPGLYSAKNKTHSRRLIWSLNDFETAQRKMRLGSLKKRNKKEKMKNQAIFLK